MNRQEIIERFFQAVNSASPWDAALLFVCGDETDINAHIYSCDAVMEALRIGAENICGYPVVFSIKEIIEADDFAVAKVEITGQDEVAQAEYVFCFDEQNGETKIAEIKE